MAHVSESAQYMQLRELIEKAIVEMEEEMQTDGEVAEGAITICISPDISEVYATMLPWWDDERLASIIGMDWYIETAIDYEDALNIAESFYDPRR